MVQKHVLDWASVFIRNLSNQPNLFIKSVSERSFNLIVVKAPDKFFWIGSKTDPIMMKIQPRYMSDIYYEKHYARILYYFEKEPR